MVEKFLHGVYLQEYILRTWEIGNDGMPGVGRRRLPEGVAKILADVTAGVNVRAEAMTEPAAAKLLVGTNWPGFRLLQQL